MFSKIIIILIKYKPIRALNCMWLRLLANILYIYILFRVLADKLYIYLLQLYISAEYSTYKYIYISTVDRNVVSGHLETGNR